MKHKLVIVAENGGDPSVGIGCTEVKITIETNCDVNDILSDIHYKDNEELFRKDIQNILAWIDDMPCSIESIKVE